MDKIRLMIVEDDPVWMKCISEYVDRENDITVVQKARTKEEALELDAAAVDVVLLDLTLDESDNAENLTGLEIAALLHDKGIHNIIMSTSWDDTDIILEAFDKGAINYVTKSSYRDIPNVVREAYHGKVNIHSDVSSTLIHALRTERKISVLTPSERELYKLKEKGFSKSQMAEMLYKSVDTIKKQLKLISSKIK